MIGDEAPRPEPLLPQAGVLLHIGPHKTGTTALQSAFAESAKGLRAVGVHPAPRKLQRVGAAAVTQRTLGGMAVGTHPSRRIWESLCRWVDRAGNHRVLVSSELFSDARDPMIPEIVAGLGSDRVRVLITVRPLEKLLPSTWQQGVKNGSVAPYPNWLRRVLRGPNDTRGSTSATKFWSRHDHATLVQRWAAVVGLDRVAVLIVDERNPEELLRNAEALIGLPWHTLRPGTNRNRSLTAEEVETVRRLYKRLGGNVDKRLKQRWIHRGAVVSLIERRQPRRNEPRLITPPDEVLRARSLSRELTDRLVATGVRIVGDPESLIPTGDCPPAPKKPPRRIDNDVAVELLAGMFRAAEVDDQAAQVMGQLTTRELLREVGGRAARRVTGRFEQEPNRTVVLPDRDRKRD